MHTLTMDASCAALTQCTLASSACNHTSNTRFAMIVSASGAGSSSRSYPRSRLQRLRQWACGTRVGESITRRPRTGVLLDLCAMLKSLFAALSILHLISPREILSCSDASFSENPHQYTVPSWFVLQQCQPSLNLDATTHWFIAFIVCNQLTFVLTSFISHANPCNVLSRVWLRTSLAYGLAVCSFLFGFCKIGLVVSIPSTASMHFPCGAPNSAFDQPSGGAGCMDVTVIVPTSLTHASQPHLMDCQSRCSFTVPVEVYVLSMTFFVTWIYSLFMCEQILSWTPDEKLELDADDEEQAEHPTTVAARLQSARGEAEDEKEKSQDHEVRSPSMEHLPASIKLSAPRSAGSALLGSSLLDPAMDPMPPSRVHSIIGRGADSDDDEVEEADDDAPAGLAASSSSRRSAAAAMVSASRISSRVPTTHDELVELDPVSRRALDVAGSLSTQQLLLCQIESGYRKSLTNRLRNRDLFYRAMRDLATLSKFILTVVSLIIIIYDTGTIVRCDLHDQDPSLAAAGITASVIFNRCKPLLQSMKPSFFFTVMSVLVAALFIAIIIVEKRVLLPSQSKGLSIFLMVGVIAVLAVQLGLMLTIENTPLNYPCSQSITVNGTFGQPFTLEQSGVCRHLLTNFTSGSGAAQPIACEDQCYVSLGLTAYILFLGLCLSLVYMASLIARYNQLAQHTLATSRKMDDEMRSLLEESMEAHDEHSERAHRDEGPEHSVDRSPSRSPKPGSSAQQRSGKGGRAQQSKVDPREVVLAILNKY